MTEEVEGYFVILSLMNCDVHYYGMLCGVMITDFCFMEIFLKTFITQGACVSLIYSLLLSKVSSL